MKLEVERLMGMGVGEDHGAKGFLGIESDAEAKMRGDQKG